MPNGRFTFGFWRCWSYEGHESIISNLRVGEIQVFDNLNNIIKSITVSGGFAEMQSEDKLLVLVNI